MLKADNTWAHHKHFLTTGHYQVGLHHPLVNSFRNTLSAHSLLYADFQHFCVGHVAINTGSSLMHSCKGINKMKIEKLTKSCKSICTQLHGKKKKILVEFSLSTEAAHNCCFWNKGQNISGCKSTDAASQYPHYSTLLSQCARKKILVCVSTSRIGILVCWNFQAVCWDFFVYFSADSHPQSSAHLTIYITYCRPHHA